MTKKNTEQDPYRPGQKDDTGRPICGARLTSKTKKDQPCGASPRKGATRCFRHGGNSPRAKAAAKRRNTETAALEILGTIDPDAPREHPVETLLNLIQAKAAEVQWLRAMVKQHTAKDLVWGEVSHEHGFGAEGIIDKRTEKAEMNIWWRQLRTAEDQLASWLEKAARAGVEERAMTLAGDTAMQLVTALNRVFAALSLSAEQQRLVPEVVPRILREISENKAA